MSTKGGFYDTFFGMDSDKACLAGILGEDLIKSDLGKIYDVAKERGLEYDFFFTDRIEKIPTEMGEFTVKSEKETIVLTGITMGGGEILIRDINGQPCEIKGMHEEEIMIKGSDKPRTVPSVYPLKTVRGAVPPFSTSAEMIEYAKSNEKPLWQAALDYECSLTGLTAEEVWKVAEETLDISYASIEAGHRDGVKFDGITVAKAPEIREKMKTTKLIPTGAADDGALDALAVMEYSNSHGIIICMPTGGASGIIPAAIKNTSKTLGKTKEDEVKALLVAGLIGVFYFPTHYHGALGCQAEVGIAASMASAGLVSFLTDDPETAERGAVLAMQYIIRQVCDPVAGYPQIPCFIRNVASVPVAMTCANYAILGLDTAVGLDGLVQAVLRVGEKLREGRINDLGTCMNEYSANPCSACGKCGK
ncbi:MAG: L-serine ammonia-lyase, iron-sulfur-dependent, subunit alpha [Anaerovoracaceae bacterium]